MIEDNLSYTDHFTCVLDTRCGAHMCDNMQNLTGRRTLRKEDENLIAGNVARVVGLAVGSYALTLPSGLFLNLKHCYFAPTRSETLYLFLDLVGGLYLYYQGQCF
ncbi:hypothetical protein Dimus_039310 [Dionaea muscipula]